MTVQEAKKYWEVFLKEIAFLKRESGSIDWEEQEQATKMAIEALEKQIAVDKVIEQIEELRNVFQEGNYTEAHCVDRCHDGCVDTDCTACVLGRIIEIIKEKVGV